MRRLPTPLLFAFAAALAAAPAVSACGDFVAGMQREDKDCSNLEEFRVLRDSPLSKDRVLVRVMTFNIWLSGAQVNDGLQKIAKQIADVNPDVVALQEVSSPDVVDNLTSLLGAPWIGFGHKINASEKYPDTAILTRHLVVDESYADVSHGMGVRIQLAPSGKQINFWSLHLEYRSYGPYACFNKLVTKMSQIEAGESPPTHGTSRVQNIVELIQHPRFTKAIEKSDIVPLIVAGDFNTPSHLDWVEENRNEHGGWVFRWPTTQLLTDTTGLIDSYRVVNPDPIETPGLTWSTVNKASSEWDYTIPEPQDRIDFIFYRGPLDVLVSRTYAGNGPLVPIPNHRDNDWPSDHYAVISAFSFTNED